MQRNKIVCNVCGQEISKSNYTKHLRRHENHPETFVASKWAVTHDGLTCQYCGKECKNKNSLCNHERLCKSNPNRDTSEHMLNDYNSKIKSGEITVWNKGLTSLSDDRVRKTQVALQKYYETHEGHMTGKHHSDYSKRKIGEGVKKFLIENPDMVPYVRNHSSKESYPEKYFEIVFQNEKMTLEKQYSFHSYRLDFCSVSKKVDIEIDGEQHYVVAKNVEHDRIRDEFLHKCGWTVYRIRWATFKKLSPEEKEKVINNIKQLL